jgi:hypothetical protein
MLLADAAVRIDRKPTRIGRKLLCSLGLALCATGTLLYAPAALTAESGNVSDVQTRYQHERAACLNGESHQDRATCLREAGAALEEAKRGHLDDGGAPYEQNKLLRCNAQPPEDREDCQRQMRGEGITRGSVADGGIYRELVTTVPAPPPAR